MLRLVASLTVPLFVMILTPAHAASGKGAGCTAAKLVAAGQYQLCRAQADAKAARKGIPADHTRCDAQLAKKFARAEQRSGGTCPTTGDEAAVRLAGMRHGDAIVDTLTSDATCSTQGLPT